MIKSTNDIGCPFSDHKFVVASLEFSSIEKLEKTILCRSFSVANLEKISEKLKNTDFSQIKSLTNSNDKLDFLNKSLLHIMDSVCPLRSSKIKQKDMYPWIDLELKSRKKERDYLYELASSSALPTDWENYREARGIFQRLNKTKMKDYFATQTARDFKNSKKYWKFYKSSVKLKHDVSILDCPNILKNGSTVASTPEGLVALFNNLFTSIDSVSLASRNECEKFIYDHFNTMKKQDDLILDKNKEFSFAEVSEQTVAQFVNSLSPSSSSGISDIHSKIIKLCPEILIPLFTDIINCSIRTEKLPVEWKTAVCTPLFKKGDKLEVSNWRSISILPPLAKVAEKIFACQITTYLDTNKILFAGQHGFRKGHSCETAL